MGDYSALVGKDELGFAHLLADYTAPELSEKASQHLIKLTKYEHASDSYHETRVRIDADTDIVAVIDPTTKAVAAVMRAFVADIPLDGGRTFKQYDVVAFRVFGKATTAGVVEEAVEHLRDLSTAVELVTARSIFGFGDGDALNAALDEEDEDNPFTGSGD